MKKTQNSSDWFNQIILDNVPVSVITIDKKGFITSVNKYFEDFSRIKDWHKHNIFNDKFFLEDHLAEDYRELLTSGKVVKRENFFEKDSEGVGEDRYFSITAVPFRDEHGNIEGAVSMAADNTEAVVNKNKLLELNNSLEEKVKERTKDLHRLNDELNKTLELKSVFMADVSHEFRTSLAIMQCSLDLLNKFCGHEKDGLELFENIGMEIKRVSMMLTDLSLLTKTDSPNLKVRFQKFDLNKSIATICQELKVVASVKFIKIEHENSEKPVEMVGNKEDVEKLILNLVRNAINYNKDSGWIKVWAEKVKEGVYLKVEDSGIGIPDSEFENIFERFYRVDKARTRNPHDSGLGLAICKHVAEMHGGHISVASKLGKGSLFTVYFPHSSLKSKTKFGKIDK
jgi:PAS domain S-box-containing protein